MRNRIRNRYDKSLENKKEGAMKKHILKSLNLFLLSSLFLSNVSIVHAEVDIKKLKEKFDIGKARGKFKDAYNEWVACRRKECKEEKTAEQAAQEKLNTIVEKKTDTWRSWHDHDRYWDRYWPIRNAYEKADKALKSCLQKKQCAEESEKMIKAEKKVARLRAAHKAARWTGKGLAVVAPVLIGTGLALGAKAAMQQSKVANIISRWNVNNSDEIKFLKKLGSSSDKDQVMKSKRGQTLSVAAAHAAQEIYNIGLLDWYQKFLNYKKFISQFNIIVEEEWKTSPAI